MKQHFAKHVNGNITVCNYPVKETGAESYSFEVNNADVEAVKDGTKDWKIVGGKLSIIASTRKAEAAAKKTAELEEEAQKKADIEALKSKLSKGEASLAEVQQALNNLL